GSESLVDDRVQLRLLKWLGEIVMSAEAHCLYDFAGIVDAGKHHDLEPRLHLAELLESFQAVDTGHQHIEEDQIRFQTFLHAGQSFLASRGGFPLVVIHLEQGADGPQHTRFLIDQQDVGRLAHLLFPRAELLGAGLSGIRKENLQPAPGSLSTQILPPIPWTSRRAMAKPRPMPSEGFSSVGTRKKSSKISR